MVRNDHRSYIHPAIILTFTVLMGGFLAYIINKPLVDAWVRIALDGDWYYLSQFVLIGVAGVSFRLGLD